MFVTCVTYSSQIHLHYGKKTDIKKTSTYCGLTTHIEYLNFVGQWTDRVTQAVRLCDTTGALGRVWGASVHGMAPASITAIHCAAAIQYTLPH